MKEAKVILVFKGGSDKNFVIIDQYLLFLFPPKFLKNVQFYNRIVLFRGL